MQSWKNSHNFGDGDRRTNETWSTGRAMAYGYDDAHQLTSVAASRPSDAARYRYDAAGVGSYWVIYRDLDKWSNDMPFYYNMIVYCVSCNTLRSTK